MTMNGGMAFIRRWWFIGAALVGLTTAWVQLKAEVEKKAEKSAVERIAADVADMKETLNDMDARQRAFFCNNQPAWCR